MYFKMIKLKYMILVLYYVNEVNKWLLTTTFKRQILNSRLPYYNV